MFLKSVSVLRLRRARVDRGKRVNYSINEEALAELLETTRSRWLRLAAACCRPQNLLRGTLRRLRDCPAAKTRKSEKSRR